MSSNTFDKLCKAGLYETLCFAGTTKSTYIFIKDSEPYFENRWGNAYLRRAGKIMGKYYNI